VGERHVTNQKDALPLGGHLRLLTGEHFRAPSKCGAEFPV